MYDLLLISIFIILFSGNIALELNVSMSIWNFTLIIILVSVFFLTNSQKAHFGLSGCHVLMSDKANEFKVVQFKNPSS